MPNFLLQLIDYFCCLSFPSNQEIHKTRSKHICQGMHEEEWKQILDHILVQEIVEETINKTNNQGPE